jgi:uncharacterized UPF0160 family protein
MHILFLYQYSEHTLSSSLWQWCDALANSHKLYERQKNAYSHQHNRFMGTDSAYLIHILSCILLFVWYNELCLHKCDSCRDLHHSEYRLQHYILIENCNLGYRVYELEGTLQSDIQDDHLIFWTTVL